MKQLLFALALSLFPAAMNAESPDAASIKVLFTAGQSAYELASTNAQYTVAAVELASQLNGGTMLVTTGR